MGRLSSTQQIKVKELKSKLKEASNELKELLSKKTGEKPTEKEQEEINSMRGVVSALADELTMAKKNRLGSKHYEWLPTGTNRRIQRAYGSFTGI